MVVPFAVPSGVFTETCVGHVMRAAGVGLRDAIDMAGARPRELLGLATWELAAGSRAPLMLFDWEPGGEVVVREVVS